MFKFVSSSFHCATKLTSAMPPNTKLTFTDGQQNLSFSLELISPIPVTSMIYTATADCTTDLRQQLEDSGCTVSTSTTTLRRM